MKKSKSGILVSVIVVALLSAGEDGNGSEANASTPATANSPPAENFTVNPAGGQPSATGTVQAVSHLGGIWAGKALIAGWPPRPPVEFAARGLVAADGRAYFLIRNTVLQTQASPYPGFVLGYLKGARLVGTALDGVTYSSGSASQARTMEQGLHVDWCGHRTPDPDICILGWNRLSLNYDRSYESGSSLDKIAGHYIDTRGQYKGVLTIAGDGYLFMQDPATGCIVNGRVAIINRAYTIYAIKLGYANCRSPALAGATFTGLVSYDGRTRQLFALMYGTAARQAAANMLAFRRQ